MKRILVIAMLVVLWMPASVLCGAQKSLKSMPGDFADTCPEADTSQDWIVKVDTELDFSMELDTTFYSDDYSPWDFGFGGCTGYTADGTDLVLRIDGGETDKCCRFTWVLFTCDASTYLLQHCAAPIDSCVAGSDKWKQPNIEESFTYCIEAHSTYYWILDCYSISCQGDGLATIEDLGAPTPAPTGTPIPSPTISPSVGPTNTATITNTPAATPTIKPTKTPTVEPTFTPTMKPTSSPTAEPTATPTTEPTATPTATNTATPSPTEPDPSCTPTKFDPTHTPTQESSPTPGSLSVSISTSSDSYNQGETMKVYIGVTNTGDDTPADAFIAAFAFDGFFFWPDFSASVNPINVMIVAGTQLSDIEICSVRVGAWGISEIKWFFALTQPGTSEILAIDEAPVTLHP